MITPISAEKLLYSKTNLYISFHYSRFKEDYDNWNIWVWPESNNGIQLNFTSYDHISRIATLELSKDCNYNAIGFIVRKSDYTNDWVQKDIEFNRYLDLSILTFDENHLDVYLIENEEEILFKASDVYYCDFKFHYYRYDNDYSNWNLWIWHDTINNRLTKIGFNNEDSFGKYGHFQYFYKKSANNLGFVLRKSMFGNDFAFCDIVSQRHLLLPKNHGITTDIFLMENSIKFFIDENKFIKSRKIVKAYFEDLQIQSCDIQKSDCYNFIAVELNFDLLLTDLFNENIILTADNEARIDISEIVLDKSITSNTTRKFAIKVCKSLEPFDKHYYILINNIDIASFISISHLFEKTDFENRFTYNLNDLGLSYHKEKSIFCVWSPNALYVKLKLYENINLEVTKIFNMKKSVNGTWSIEIQEDLLGYFYTFEVNIDGLINEACDPYAKAVSVNGNFGAVVNLADTDPKGFRTHLKPILRSIQDSIIYELHIRDISTYKDSGIVNKGKYLGLTETGTKNIDNEKTGLDHLIDLGITHVHLLPVFDFITIDESSLADNVYSWGYDPLNYNVPEGSYSTNPCLINSRIFEFKKMIQTLHQSGIRVILDVVYNHTAKTEDSSLNKIVPDYYYRKNDSGDFSNGSGCGNELATQRPMVRKMIIDSLKYWAKEYRVDGFRFDLMGLIDIDTMKQIRTELDNLEENILLYGEGWTADYSPLPYYKKAIKQNIHILPGIAAFRDDGRDAIKGSTFNSYEPGFANGGSYKEDTIRALVTGFSRHHQVNSCYTQDILPSQTINYVSSHDNLTLWDKISLTNQYSSKEEKQKIIKLCYGILFTSQGIPFMQEGDELLRTKGLNHNSYNSPDNINQIDWSRKTKYKDVFEFFKTIIKLRKDHPAFRMNNIKEINDNLEFLFYPIPNFVGFILKNHANGDIWKDIAVFYNPNFESKEIVLPQGNWSFVLYDSCFYDPTQSNNMKIVDSSKINIPGISIDILANIIE